MYASLFGCLKCQSFAPFLGRQLATQLSNNFLKCGSNKNAIYVVKTTPLFRNFTISKIKFQNKGKQVEGNAANKNKKAKTLPKLSDIRRLLVTAHAERWRISGAIFFLIISSSVTLAVPYCMGKVIDIINESAKDGTLMDKLTSFCAVLLVIFFIGGLANFARYYLMEVAEQRIIIQVREKLFSSVMKQEIGFFDKTKTGEVISRLSSDAAMIGNAVTFNISDGLRAVAQAGGSIAMMLYVSPKLAAVAMSIVPPIALMSIVYGRYVKKLTKQVQDALAGSTSIAEERISNIRTVRAFTKEDFEIGMYNTALSKVLALAYKQALAGAVFWGSTGFSGNLIILSVFYAGGYMMSQSLLTIGNLSAFLLYAAYVGISMGGITSFYSELMRGLGASSRIWELTDRVPHVPFTGGMIPSTPVQGNIEFRNVKFTYPTREEAVILSNLNLTMPAGSVTAVVGASGSGKSTIGSLLMRFYDTNSGDIFLDGHNIRDLDPQWLRYQIGVVSQEPALFSCSIADNIRYGAMDPSSVTMEMMIDAAREANALMFIQQFPDQFDTMVGERGLALSGGQKQRIALARAIIEKPRILLLDEATSALDTESEFFVKEALNRLMVGRTVITIAHRLSTIKTADQIAVLDQGCVRELGTYEQLASLEDGIFRKLVNKQTIMS